MPTNLGHRWACLILLVATACGTAPAAPADDGATTVDADVTVGGQPDGAVAEAGVDGAQDAVADVAPTDDTAVDADAAPDLADGHDDAADATTLDGAAADTADAVDASNDATACGSCGDGNCQTACGETLGNCSSDCVKCGDNICSPGESPKSCAVDCCGSCGDGKCVGYECGENPSTCPQDCQSPCGDKICEKGENPQNCPEDCAWKSCGNFICEPEDGGPTNCPTDCKPGCGNCICEKGEDFTTCPVDCGYCGDGICSTCTAAGENPLTCGADCKGEECTLNAPGACDDGNPCTTDSCTNNGMCLHAQNKLPCDDGNACTVGDACGTGVCLSGTVTLSCDDDNPCTSDGCDASVGCKHGKIIGTACDDGNACTQSDKCTGGACVGGAALQCNDFNACTDDACDPISGCVHTFNSAPCEDGNACTKNDACLNGACAGGPPLNCDDGNPCTTDSCLPDQGCSHASADGLCNDQNPCTTDSCVPGKGCVNTTTVGACDDGNPCTAQDTCLNSICTPLKPFACDDGNPCTDDACDGKTGACSHSASVGSCEDGNLCTLGDKCLDGVCLPGAPNNCDDQNVCTDDSCTPATGQCQHTANSAPCSDDNACTLGETCAGGQCASKGIVTCIDDDPCTADSCDPKTGLCSHLTTPACFKPACLAASDCAPGQLCEANSHTCRDCLTTADCPAAGQVCQAGSCVAGTKCLSSVACKAKGQVCNTGAGYCVECLTSNDCAAGFLCVGVACMVKLPCASDKECPAVCDPTLGACVECATSNDCLDGGQCGIDHACHAPVCAGVACKGGSHSDGTGTGGAPMTCKPDGSGFAVGSCAGSNVCLDDGCDAKANCVHLPNSATCQDGDVCTPVDQCVGGVCKPGSKTVCDDNNACTLDLCDGKGGCQYLAIDASCDDGNACTDDACNTTNGCVHANNSAFCDAKSCTIGDVCSGGTCMSSGVNGQFDVRPHGNDAGNSWAIRAIAEFGNGDLALAGAFNGGNFVSRYNAVNGHVWDYANGDGNFHIYATVVLADQSMSGLGWWSSWTTLWHFDSNGAFGSGQINNSAFCMAATNYAGGTVLAAGGDNSLGYWRGYVWTLTGYTPTGGVAWGWQGYDWFNALAIGPQNDFAAVGQGTPGGDPKAAFQGTFAHFAADGTNLGTAVTGSSANDVFTGVVAAEDGGFLASGYTSPSSGGLQQGWLVHLANDGSILWDRNYGGPGDDAFNGIARDANGGYYAAGSLTQNASIDGWLVKLDTWGNVIWQRTWGGPNLDYFNAVQVLKTGNLAFGGQTWNGTTYPQDWLLRTDPWGNSSCAGAGVCVGVASNGCDDGNPCTADTCNVLSGCVHVGHPDGAPCGGGKVCAAAVCK